MRWLIVMVMLLGGCVTPRRAASGAYVTGSYIYLAGTPYAEEKLRRDPETVEIYYKKEPRRAFVEIGLVEAVARGPKVSLQDLFPELARQAAYIDADAIFKIELQRYDHAGDALYATAVAVRFR